MRHPFRSSLLMLSLFAFGASAQSSSAAKPHGSQSSAMPSDAPTAGQQPPQQVKPEDVDKVLYVLGASIGRTLSVFSLSKAELAMVQRGLNDQVTGQKLKYDLETYGPQIQTLAKTRSDAKAAVEKKKGDAYLEKAAKEPGMQKLANGILYKEVKAGTGASPKPTDTVKVNYRGTTLDGHEFDSSYKRNEPAQFQLNQVIPCWTEAVQKMKVGGKAQVLCPSSQAYGDRGMPPTIPGGAVLKFEIELLDVSAGGAATPAPQH